MSRLSALALSALAWAAVLVIPSLAAAQELTFWHAYRDGEARALDAIVSDWNDAHPDAKVTALAIPPQAYASKLTNAIPRGNGPDVFIFAHERVGEWSNSGVVLPWDAEHAPWSAYHPAANAALQVDGTQWGVPLALNSPVLFYNKALVETPPETTDRLIELAREHTDAADGRYGLAYQAADFFFHAAWVHGFGGQIFDESGGFGLDSPEAADAYAFAHQLVMEDRVVPEDASGALVSQLFREGRAAMVVNGPWFIGELQNTEGLDYGLAPLPVVGSTGKPASPLLTVEAAFVAPFQGEGEGGEATVAMARKFAAHLASPEVATRRALEAAQPVATLATYDDARVAADPALSTFRRQLDAAVPTPNRPEMSSVWEPANVALRQVLRGALEPRAALGAAATRYRIYTRPTPEASDPTPLLVLVGMFLLGLAGWSVHVFRRDDVWARMKESKAAYAYMAPAVIGMILLIVAPFVVGSAVSLFAHRGGEFTFVGLSNFVNILTSADYGLTDPLSFYFTLGVTVVWTAANVVLHVSIGMALALLLREPWLKLRGVYRVLLIVPWAIPNYITALIWKGMFPKQFGAINGILAAFGVEPISWFSQFSTAFAANVATNTWLGFPFMMVVVLGALQAIPRDLEEAAEVDGATWWQRFRHVVFPLLRPALVPAVVLGTVWTFNMFNIIYLVSGGEPEGGTEILISEAYKWAFTRQQQYGYAAAYSVLIFFVLLAYSGATGQLDTGED